MPAKQIGPTFAAELVAAGLSGLPFSWSDAGVFNFDAAMTQQQRDAVTAVYTAHNPATLPAEQVRAGTFTADATRVEWLNALRTSTLAQIDTFVRGKINQAGVTDLASAKACLGRVETALVIIAKLIALDIKR